MKSLIKFVQILSYLVRKMKVVLDLTEEEAIELAELLMEKMPTIAMVVLNQVKQEKIRRFYEQELRIPYLAP